MYYTTRANINYVTSLLLDLCKSQTRSTLMLQKSVLRYVKETCTFWLMYERNEESKLLVFCDSDLTRSADDLRITSGYGFSVGFAIFLWALLVIQVVRKCCIAFGKSRIYRCQHGNIIGNMV